MLNLKLLLFVVKKLKLISSKNRTIKFFCSFFVRAVIHSLEFRCAFKQDQVDFLVEKLVFPLNFNGLSERFMD